MAAPVLTPALLGRPARAGARLMARGYLERVLEAAARVEVRVDPSTEPGASDERGQPNDSVHDLRVALRRLRSWLRAWRPYLKGTVHKRSERPFRRLSRLAGKARDLEVQREYLTRGRVQRSRLAGQRARWMVAEIDTDFDKARRALADALLRDLGPAAATLAAELQDPPVGDAGETNEPTTGVALARLIEERVDTLPGALGRVDSMTQVEAAHEARIAVKRLRYLLDSLGSKPRRAHSAAKTLTTLQDRLGRLHDAHILDARLADASKKAKRRRMRGKARTPIPGTVSALRAIVHQTIEKEFGYAHRSIGARSLAKALNAAKGTMASLRGDTDRLSIDSSPAPRSIAD